MGKKYTTLLFDFDDTLFDFTASSKFALQKTFEQYHIIFTEEYFELFERINKQLWEAFERGEYTKEQILPLRFSMMFDNASIDCEAFNSSYLDNISNSVFPFEGTYELCEQLSKSYDMYIVTNSVERVILNRMARSGMDKYFLNCFISERIGAAKPDKKYFEYALGHINEKDKARVLIIGDSTTSDILGGINAGIDTCWLDRNGRNPQAIKPTYTVHSYDELLKLIEDL